MKFPGPSEYLGMNYSSMLGLIYYFYTGRLDWITEEIVNTSSIYLISFNDKKIKIPIYLFIASRLYFGYNILIILVLVKLDSLSNLNNCKKCKINIKANFELQLKKQHYLFKIV